MKGILLLLTLFCLPLGTFADGMVIPTVAYPAQVTIPDQRALISFSNDVERLVIETRFTGEGTNFAWVVPLPSPPVIEAATAGLFPTLQYLFRPEIVHDVPRYYVGILLALAFVFLLWRASRSVWSGLLFTLLLLVLAVALLPILGGVKLRSLAKSADLSASDVSILDRKLVGIFETTTIASHDPKALEAWLRENNFAVATNAAPVIASYVNDGWVFVASKIRRDTTNFDIATPHPLSFTFKTARAVYPMRLTGLNAKSLKVDLYVFGEGNARARHFSVERCIRLGLKHPLLQSWFGDTKVVTKLTADLSSAQMRRDVWLDLSPDYVQVYHRLYSRQGALSTALNWGTGLLVAGLVIVCLRRENRGSKLKLFRQLGTTLGACGLAAVLIYFSLPKIEVKLIRGHFWSESQEQQIVLLMALDDAGWRTMTEARAVLQTFLSNPTNAAGYYIRNFENPFVGGQVREEDSPGNYLLRETNNQLELVFFYPDGSAQVALQKDLSLRR